MARCHAALAYAAAEAEQHFAPDPETALGVDQAAALDAPAPDTDYGFDANQEPPVDIYYVQPDFDDASAVSNTPQSEVIALAHPREIGELLNAEPSTGPDSGSEPVMVPEIDRGAEAKCSPAHAQETGAHPYGSAPVSCVVHSPVPTFPRHGVGGGVGRDLPSPIGHRDRNVSQSRSEWALGQGIDSSRRPDIIDHARLRDLGITERTRASRRLRRI